MNKFEYKNVPLDREGWADAAKFMPGDFDLCYLRLSTGKVKMGWASGFAWDGHKVKTEDEIVYWKRKSTPMMED